MKILETARLRLRPFTLDDADFVRELLNDPDFVEHVGDRGVRTLDDAALYLRNGPLAMYAQYGVGLLVVEDKSSGEALGTCGLLRRDELDEPDVGYAFLPRFRGCGYAVEASSASLRFARDDLRLERVVAIVSSTNRRSIRVLEKLGLHYERSIELSNDPAELRLYAVRF